MGTATTRAVTDPSVPVTLPAPIGKTALLYRVAETGWLEVELEPFMARLNERIVARGEEPYANVWDALEEISEMSPMQVMPLLLRAGLRHHGDGTDDLVDELPPHVWNDAGANDAITKALALAFGVDPEEQAKKAAKTPPRKAARAGGHR